MLTVTLRDNNLKHSTSSTYINVVRNCILFNPSLAVWVLEFLNKRISRWEVTYLSIVNEKNLFLFWLHHQSPRADCRSRTGPISHWKCDAIPTRRNPLKSMVGASFPTVTIRFICFERKTEYDSATSCLASRRSTN